MTREALKSTIYKLVAQMDDEKLLRECLEVLQKSVAPTSSFFCSTEEDMKARAEASIESVKLGKGKRIDDFKKEMGQWKQNGATQ